MAGIDRENEGPSGTMQRDGHQMVADFPGSLRQSGDPCCLVAGSRTRESAEVEQHQITSDGEDSFSSDAGIWIPDEPYGSRGRLANAVSDLKRDQGFTDECVEPCFWPCFD